MGGISAGLKEARNLEIYKAIGEGVEVSTLADTYRLAPRTIRDISKRQAEKYASTNGGSKKTSGELGLTGLKHDGWGTIHEEFLRELATPLSRYKNFNEMRQNSAVAGAMLLAIELSIKRVEWHIEGEAEDPRTEFIDGAYHDMSHSMDQHVGEALTMCPFGFAPFEIVYKRRQGEEGECPSAFSDGKIGWRKFAFRSQDSLHSWDMDETGGLKGMRQQTWPDWKLRYIPIEKMLLYRTTSEKGNPEGRSLLRPAWTSYYYAKNLQTIEAIGVERDLAGLPMIEGPEGADLSEGSDDLSLAEKIVRRIRNDEAAGAVIPFGWKLTLLSSPGSKQVNAREVIEAYDKRIAMSVMAQFLVLGMDKVGSYSLGKDQSDFFLMAISALADNICETFNKYAIPRLLKLNGMPATDAPKLTHGAVSKPDLAMVGDIISKLAPTGFIQPDDEFEKWLRSLLNAPELTEEVLAEREERAARAPQPPTQSKPGDGEMMGEGDPDIEEMLKKMSLRDQTAYFASNGNGIRQRIKRIPDKRTRKAILDGSKALTDLNRDLTRQSLDRLKGITDEEWDRAVEKDEQKGRDSGA